MKIARISTAQRGEVLAIVGEGVVRIVEGHSVDELVTIAMTRSIEGLELGESLSFGEVDFLAPIARPISIRDFSAFEAHTKNVVEAGGAEMNPRWYDFPIFYFSNPSAVIGDFEAVVPPKTSKLLDFELEVACVVGSAIRDLEPGDANWTSHIAGFTLMNDWSARDFGAKELPLLFGPAKAKDFATTLGPWLTTPDEFVIVNGRMDLPLTVRVNGNVWGQGNVNDLHFDWTRLLAHASADCTVYPGEVIGTGTCGNGCILELRMTQGKDRFAWLKSGDVVEISAPGLGKLTNSVKRAEVAH